MNQKYAAQAIPKDKSHGLVLNRPVLFLKPLTGRGKMHTYSVPEDILADKRHKNWFWDSNEVFNSGLSVNAIVVRLYLARCANGERQAWPSLNTIARSCGISKPTVIKALKELEEKGWITKKIQRRASLEYTTTIYTLNDPPKPSSSSGEGGGKGDLPPVKIETASKEGVVNDVDQVVKQVDNLVNDVDNVVNEVDPNNTHITIPREEIPMEEKEMLLSSLRSDNNISGPALRAPS
ncbi:MAG: helix-turn-helix domain-containing protein, partial [Peptococcaceae bacterium]|nr:helix-turn-helix domain-containing protein [Peptococcaceae bacterium]